ncbi:MAG TPA: hypothetical protein VJH88_04390, partial [Candidatus Nanoarchaeia archaeon]|nr:hypothetical protein [Candidatus Nanoarchaeia archaeon]
MSSIEDSTSTFFDMQVVFSRGSFIALDNVSIQLSRLNVALTIIFPFVGTPRTCLILRGKTNLPFLSNEMKILHLLFRGSL